MSKELIKPVISLFVITAVVAALLGFVHEITLEPIAIQQKLVEEKTMKEVLPEAEEFKELEWKQPEDGEGVIVQKITEGFKNGELCGYVVLIAPTNGFSGTFTQMLGIDKDGVITGLRVLSHSETPGLGAKAKDDPEFYEQFNGKKSVDFEAKKSLDLAVTKDGGDIDAITSATITSRAVVDGINAAASVLSQEVSE